MTYARPTHIYDARRMCPQSDRSIRTPCPTGCPRRVATGRSRRSSWPRDVGARQHDRQHRAALDRAGFCRHGRGVDLGGQRLSAGDPHPAAAARLPRGDRRLPASLPVRPGTVHPRLARLRARPDAAHSEHRTRDSGNRRRRHHERERCAGALHLSAALPGAGHRHQRLRGRGLRGARPHHCLGRPGRGALALALRHQRADRPGDAR